MKRFALIGKDIKGSFSPAIHSYCFEAMGLDADYGIIDIESNSRVPDIIAQLRDGGLDGINITAPYKKDFTPDWETYDRLFDQGYITFTDEGELICGTLLTKDSWEKLNINPLERKKYEIFPVGREEYLEWHRKNIFRH